MRHPGCREADRGQQLSGAIQGRQAKGRRPRYRTGRYGQGALKLEGGGIKPVCKNLVFVQNQLFKNLVFVQLILGLFAYFTEKQCIAKEKDGIAYLPIYMVPLL